jgi:hypothetical protein
VSDDRRTPLERLIDRLVELSDAAEDPDVKLALYGAAATIDSYRLLHGDLTVEPGEGMGLGILAGNRNSLPPRPAGPVPNRRQRRAITVRRGR